MAGKPAATRTKKERDLEEMLETFVKVSGIDISVPKLDCGASAHFVSEEYFLNNIKFFTNIRDEVKTWGAMVLNLYLIIELLWN